ncbi:MAG TPA: TRAP transporter large permease subunit, partial [Ottowia sp.]|nr:TRAP transporter large permease subunit [Ottowia sp.]
FLDGFSMIVMTLPIVLPIIKTAGYDLIWFGIFVVVVVEMAQITPPVGFNLFVLQGMTKRDIAYIARVTLPFFFLMCAMVLLLWFFPQIATWLPKNM